MKNKYKFALSFSIIILSFSIFLSGCVNYDQQTTLNQDGSGKMKIHYWTKMNNMTTTSSVGKFDFDKRNAKYDYSSTNSAVDDINAEDNLVDSTRHVQIDLSFNDITKLSEAKGFADVSSSWNASANGMELKYVVAQDTTAAHNIGASDYTITYTFEMPGEIISSNADKKDGNTLTWMFKVSDLKNDLEMNALVSFKK